MSDYEPFVHDHALQDAREGRLWLVRIQRREQLQPDLRQVDGVNTGRREAGSETSTYKGLKRITHGGLGENAFKKSKIEVQSSQKHKVLLFPLLF